MDIADRIRPMGILRSFVAGVVPATILYVTHYVLVPAFVLRTGQSYLVGYLLGWASTMTLFFIGALAAHRLEGNPWRWSAFTARYRLGRMSGQDWAWTGGMFAFILASYLGLSFTARWLAQHPWFAPHPIFPTELQPGGATARAPGMLMGSPITGVGWVAVAYAVGWFFNIAGEELWFRGYVLPRQEAAMGRHAWIANGLMFTLNHIWQPWNLLVLLPGALVASLVAQRRRSTWILMIAHGVANAAGVVVAALNALGLVI